MAIVIDSVTKLTYDDDVLLPDDGRIHEIIDGEHYRTPCPETCHQTLSRRIKFQLYEQIELTHRGLVFNAPTDVQLSEIDIVQPDLLVILAPPRLHRFSEEGHRTAGSFHDAVEYTAIEGVSVDLTKVW